MPYRFSMVAFRRITYRCPESGDTETLWNSRDGLLPNNVRHATTGSLMDLVDRSEPDPEYTPQVGERIFVDLTQIRARATAIEILDEANPEMRAVLESVYDTREEAIEGGIEYITGAYADLGSTAPDVLVVNDGYLHELARKRRSVYDAITESWLDPEDGSIVMSRAAWYEYRDAALKLPPAQTRVDVIESGHARHDLINRVRLEAADELKRSLEHQLKTEPERSRREVIETFIDFAASEQERWQREARGEAPVRADPPIDGLTAAAASAAYERALAAIAELPAEYREQAKHDVRDLLEPPAVDSATLLQMTRAATEHLERLSLRAQHELRWKGAQADLETFKLDPNDTIAFNPPANERADLSPAAQEHLDRLSQRIEQDGLRVTDIGHDRLLATTDRTEYYDIDGKRISFEIWSDLVSNEAYRLLHTTQFLNGQVTVMTRWVGIDLPVGARNYPGRQPQIFVSDILTDRFPTETLTGASKDEAHLNHLEQCKYVADTLHTELDQREVYICDRCHQRPGIMAAVDPNTRAVIGRYCRVCRDEPRKPN